MEDLNKEKGWEGGKHVKFNSISSLVMTVLYNPGESYGAEVWLLFFEYNLQKECTSSFSYNIFIPFPSLLGYGKT